MQTQFTIGVSKAGRSFELDFAKLPESAQDYVLDYGLRQILNDCLSGAENPKDKQGAAKDKVLADNVKTVEAKIKALQDGTVRMTRGSTADPVEREAKRIALDLVQSGPKFKAWLAGEKIKLSGNERKADDERARAELWDRVKRVMATDQVMAEARKRVANADKAFADLEV